MPIQNPPFKMYDAEGVFVGGAADLRIAHAVFAHEAWDGWTVRLGHSPRNTLWTEGKDGHAKASFDKFAEAVTAAIPKNKKPHPVRRLNKAESAAKQAERQEKAAAAEQAKAERAAKRVEAVTKKDEAPAKATVVRPIRPAPKAAAKPLTSKAAASKAASKSTASKNVVHEAKPDPKASEPAASRTRKPATRR